MCEQTSEPLPLETLVLDTRTRELVLNALYEKKLDVEQRYLGGKSEPLVAEATDRCCPEHEMLFERRSATHDALLSQVHGITEMIERIEGLRIDQQTEGTTE